MSIAARSARFLVTFSLTILFAFQLEAQSGSPAELKVVPPRVACAALKIVDVSGPVGAKTTLQEAVEVQDGQPAPYCRVLGTIAPAIQFEVRLPLGGWTQRYLQTGCGGLCGTLNISTPRADSCVPVTNGDVVLASTDMGHRNGPGRGNADPTWAVENPQSKIDFAYRGVHLTAIAAKALIEKFYGQKPRYSYFSGCSDGGREALMEAQRYPQDFDGIAAGAPAMNFVTQNTFYHGWNAWKNTDSTGNAILTPDKLPILHQAALDACDALDGLKDGQITVPSACHFDPDVTICKDGQDGATCLTPAQAATAKAIYQGARTETGKKLVIGGPQPGSELFWQGVYVPQRAGAAIFSTGISLGTIKYLAYEKPLAPEFGLKDFHFDRDNFDAIAQMHPIYDATDPDLEKFSAAGGKLLMFHGWSDPHISPLNSIAYYTAMERTMGEAKVSKFARLFLFPGGGHCNGGDGPFDFPLLSLLVNWVEGGTPPNAILASRKQGGKVDRTRPVYPFPMVAKYKGAGDPNAASSFEGVRDPQVTPEQLDWLGAAFYLPGYEKSCEWTGTEMKCKR